MVLRGVEGWRGITIFTDSQPIALALTVASDRLILNGDDYPRWFFSFDRRTNIFLLDARLTPLV